VKVLVLGATGGTGRLIARDVNAVAVQLLRGCAWRGDHERIV
jgi:hypothetical protein